jgi:hypothetical protein
MNLLAIIGMLLLIVGIFLFFGNITGCASTFPLAGFITMSIGSLMLKAGKEEY